MSLSKSYDCILHNLRIVKFYAYSFSQNSVTFIFSYLERQKEKVKVNNALTESLTLILGIYQGSTLGPTLFNIFQMTYSQH